MPTTAAAPDGVSLYLFFFVVVRRLTCVGHDCTRPQVDRRGKLYAAIKYIAQYQSDFFFSSTNFLRCSFTLFCLSPKAFQAVDLYFLFFCIHKAIINYVLHRTSHSSGLYIITLFFKSVFKFICYILRYVPPTLIVSKAK